MDFIKINYTGRVKDGKIFDTTYEETAKKENMHDPKRVYKPMNVAVGQGQIIKGLDEALKDVKVGEKKTVTIESENAYGPKNPAYVRLVPVKYFKQQGINPIPGMPIEIDNMHGRVQTVSGGRVRVDFNHELAGKTLVFDVEVVGKAKTDEERVDYIIERNFEGTEGFKTKLEGKKLEITLPKKAFHDRNIVVRKASLTADAFKFLELAEVVFQEAWENPKDEEKKDKKEDKPEKKKD
jgi:FKBP-type peptidyl-prolyl cis-trans isomerase 2